MAALIAASAAPARAEKPSNADIVKAKQLYKSAREHKQAADDLAARGQQKQARAAYGQAAKDYLEAHRLTHLPAFLYNLGSIYRLRGEKQWALRCYRAFLVSEPEDENDIRDALAFINELKKELRDQPVGASSEPWGDAETRLGQAAGGERALLQNVVDACDTGKSRATLSNVMQGATVVGLLAAGFLFYKGYMSPRGTVDTPQAARLTPLIAPTAIGAEFTLDF